MAEDIFKSFLHANSETETHAIYYRWSLISTIGALLGRQTHLQHGHFNIYPTLYVMLIGTAGARKSTAIKLCKKILRATGYETIAADKTSKEKFLVDLAGESDDHDAKNVDNILNENLFGPEADGKDCEVFIMADEANDFFGMNNIEFLSLLGNLWDYEGTFTYRIKTGKSLAINNPTVSILSANTPTGFAAAFPSEILGQGFFSRLLLIHGESNGKRFAFPKGMGPEEIGEYAEALAEIKRSASGHMQIKRSAESLLNKIYNAFKYLPDPRFESYSTRRFSQLLKLSTIQASTRFSNQISEVDVIAANTILSHAELFMPKALGEFGKNKDSDITHRIVQLIDSAGDVVSFKQLWKLVCNDLAKPADLSVLLQNLVGAEKIQSVPGGIGFLPKKLLVEQVDSSLLDYSILTEEELGMTL
jgi:uncharacterized protein DUF3987